MQTASGGLLLCVNRVDMPDRQTIRRMVELGLKAEAK
jgi:hypothetical protein